MISGAFAIIAQSQILGCFPRVRVNHTSTKFQGQVYIPEINYVLMVLCVAVTAIFQTTDKIGNAYGKKSLKSRTRNKYPFLLTQDKNMEQVIQYLNSFSLRDWDIISLCR
ncbi:hypothetical protein ABZP36_026348 [Zizania latifolia]